MLLVDAGGGAAEEVAEVALVGVEGGKEPGDRGEEGRGAAEPGVEGLSPVGEDQCVQEM